MYIARKKTFHHLGNLTATKWMCL